MFQNRILNFRQKMREQNIDACLITKRQNYMYFSGFTGSTGILVITEDELVVLVDSRYDEQARGQCSECRIIRFDDIFLEINNIISAKGILRLGFEDTNLTFNKHADFVKKIKVEELVPIGHVISEIRTIKDSIEIEYVKKAVEIADIAFSHALKVIKPGISELAVAAEIEYSMKKNGAEGNSFETIVGSGRRSSLPHAVASEKIIEYGDMVVLDFGALYKGYCSDMSRTIFVGKKPDGDVKKLYDTVLYAQLEATKSVKSGTIASEVDSVARDIIKAEGYGEYFSHGLGHGVGLDIHEAPRVSQRSDIKLQRGMVLTVEPGIYVPGLGGVRIEDIVVVAGDIPMVLTRSPKEILVL